MKQLKHKIHRISFVRILLSSTGAKHAELKILFGYALYALVGTLLLCLPFSTKHELGLIDNLFNAMSALSTTGLSPSVLGRDYTFFGQLMLLGLIQIGGVGFMTLSSYILLASFHHIHLTKKNLLDITLSRPVGFSLKELIRTIIIFTVLVEFIGTVALAGCFYRTGENNVLWHAVFHSVSSFCTAGFSTFPTGLEPFKFNTSINIVVSALCYMGAIGFIVVLDIWKKFTVRTHKLTFTTKIILLVTTLMALFGTAVLYFTEASFQQYTPWNRLLVSSFHAMTSMTTVGYNTVPIGTLSSATLMTIVLLMLIGASPSGTGGGLKSTAIPTIFGLLKSKINNQEKVTVFGNTIPKNRANAALSAFILYVVTVFVGTYALSFTDSHDMFPLFFEVASALGTVGLSTGITPEITGAGKIVLIIVMMIGRVGVVTFGAVFLHRAGKEYTEMQSETDIAI